jgi:hypothetical protein
LKLVDTDETVLIVTGSDLPAEMNDRSTAYALKAEIDRLGGGGAGFRMAVVVSDQWYGANRIFQICPTIAVGGPGVNAVAAALVEELPELLRREDRVFIQGAWDGEMKRVVLWGMDRVATAQAARAFLDEGHCAGFLNAVWKRIRAPRKVDLA